MLHQNIYDEALRVMQAFSLPLDLEYLNDPWTPRHIVNRMCDDGVVRDMYFVYFFSDVERQTKDRWTVFVDSGTARVFMITGSWTRWIVEYDGDGSLHRRDSPYQPYVQSSAPATDMLLIMSIVDEFIGLDFPGKDFGDHTRNAFENMEPIYAFRVANDMVWWPWHVDLTKTEDPYYLWIEEPYPQYPRYPRYLSFFALCPAVSVVFKLYSDHVGWNETLTDEEIDDIRMYITARIRERIRSSEIRVYPRR